VNEELPKGSVPSKDP